MACSALGNDKATRCVKFCNAIVWDEDLRYNIRSQVNPVLETATGDLPQLAAWSRSNLHHSALRSSGVRKVVFTCRMNTYPLRLDCLAWTARFFSILAEASSYFRNIASMDRAWLYHWTHMGSLICEAPDGQDATYIQYQDETGYPRRVLSIIQQLSERQEPHSPGRFYIYCTCLCEKTYFCRPRA